jgi:hypothetical protein
VWGYLFPERNCERRCQTSFHVFHPDGTVDSTAPPQGRKIMHGFIEGNVFDAMGTWLAVNGYSSETPRCNAYPWLLIHQTLDPLRAGGQP